MGPPPKSQNQRGILLKNNGKTQNQTILGQLNGGIRYFDLRPLFMNPWWPFGDGFFQIYHGGDWAIAWGPLLEDVVADVVTFMQQTSEEIVVLKFSHMRNFDDDVFCYFLQQLAPLSPWCYNQGSSNTRLAGTQLSAMKRKLIIVNDYPAPPTCSNVPNVFSYADAGSKTPNPQGANLIVYDEYSDSDNYTTMLQDQTTKFDSYTGSCVNWPNTQSDLFLLSFTLTAPFYSTPWKVSQGANPNLPAAFQQSFQPQTWPPPSPRPGKKTVNIVYVDYFETSHVMDVCWTFNANLVQ